MIEGPITSIQYDPIISNHNPIVKFATSLSIGYSQYHNSSFS